MNFVTFEGPTEIPVGLLRFCKMEEETIGYTCTLSSRRVTTARIKDIATCLGLPTDATKDDLLSMIESKLAEGGSEPQNVQVTVSGRKLTLVDESGVFLDVKTNLEGALI